MSELTLDDIAKEVGVSRATVSRVVNGMPNVSLELRTRVLESIWSSGFHPNSAARSLVARQKSSPYIKTSMIGLVIPRNISSFFSDPFLPILSNGITKACKDHDLSLSIFLVANKEDEEKLFARISRPDMLDGVLVLAGEYGHELIDSLQKSSIPSLLIGRPINQLEKNFIDIDNVETTNMAVCRLIDQGYKRISILAGINNQPISFDCIKGYSLALHKNLRKVNKNLVVDGLFSEESGYEAMKRLLPHFPEAVFTTSNTIAMGAMRAVLEEGLRIPEDVVFVGIEDFQNNLIANNQLAQIRQPVIQIGSESVEMLVDLITNGTKPVRSLLLSGELVLREPNFARKHRVSQIG